MIKKLNQNGFAGFSDWRLPTLEEAMSLMEPRKKNDLYINPIFDSKQRRIWTTDHIPGDARSVWVILFNWGYCHGYAFDRNELYISVRAVRSEQSLTE